MISLTQDMNPPQPAIDPWEQAVTDLVSVLIRASELRRAEPYPDLALTKAFFRVIGLMAIALTDMGTLTKVQALAVDDCEQDLGGLSATERQVARAAIAMFTDRLMTLGGRS